MESCAGNPFLEQAAQRPFGEVPHTAMRLVLSSSYNIITGLRYKAGIYLETRTDTKKALKRRDERYEVNDMLKISTRRMTKTTKKRRIAGLAARGCFSGR
jgi:hypothetical protein